MKNQAGLEPLSYRACVLGAWLSFIGCVYITLLPFTFIEGPSFSAAWSSYWGNLELSGAWGSNRDQWLFNLLLFTPLGFFSVAWLTWGISSPAARMFGAVTAALIALVVSAGVEFFQQWLPYRWPAMKDIAGNFTGGVLGAGGWFVLRNPLREWLEDLYGRGIRSLRLGLIAYSVSYVIVGVLPFNLVLAPADLLERLASDAVVVWSPPGGAGDLVSFVELGVKILAAIPVGLALVVIWPWLLRRPVLFGVPVAAFSGILLEGLDIISAAGIAEGRSVVLRACGLICGIALGSRAAALGNDAGRRVISGLYRYAWPAVLIGLPLHLGMLVAIHFGFNPAGDFSAVWERVRQTNLVPFSYHYHVGELHALRSIVQNLALYAPLGLWTWLVALRLQASQRATVIWAALGAVVMAALLEAGQLWLAAERLDTSAPLVAAAAAAAVAAVGCWFVKVLKGEAQAEAVPGELAGTDATTLSPEPNGIPPISSWGSLRGRWVQLAGGGLILIVTAVAMSWPVAPGLLTLGLFGYVLLLWRYPLAWLWLLPALVVILDWTLWTGWLHVAEFDLFLLATLAVTLLRDKWPTSGPILPRGVSFILVLLVISTIISLGLALWPLPPLDPGLLSHYATGWNGLRVATGLLGVGILLMAVRASPESPRQQLEHGLVPGLGLAWLVCAAVLLRERALYPGLFGFEHPYRVSGWFADMHVGGPSVESFLVISLPFAMFWVWRRCSSWYLRMIGVSAVALVGGYLVIVTYSRAGILGLIGALLVMSLALLCNRPGRLGEYPVLARTALAALPLAVLGTTIFVFSSKGELAERWSTIEQDLQGRVEHWQLSLELAQHGGSMLWGRGLGAFAEDFRYAAAARGNAVPENFEFIGHGPFSTLRLGGGASLYLNQRLRVPRDESYRLSMEVRGVAGSRLDASVCEKPVRHSFTCRWQRFEIEAGNGSDNDTATIEWSFDLAGFDQGPSWFQRGAVLSLAHGGGSEGLIEIESVRLFDSHGRNHLRNPDFAEAGRHWYFTTDYLWPYRTENQWLEFYYDQGGFGLLAFSLLIVTVLAILIRRLTQGDALAATCLAALTGVLVIGVFSTIFFNPKIALLFYLVSLLGVGRCDHPRWVT